MELREQFERVKSASKELALISDERKNKILLSVAQAIIQQKDMLLEENAKDLARMDKSNPLYDRLQLTEARLEGIASDMRHVATLENPLGKVLKHRILENGLILSIKEGESSLLSASLREKNIRINFYYNRTFRKKDFDGTDYQGSYSRPFRPDYTISIFPYSYTEKQAILSEIKHLLGLLNLSNAES